MERGDDTLVARFDGRHSVAAAQIVDAFEPDHMGEAASPAMPEARMTRS
jgi:hypothetical protein